MAIIQSTLSTGDPLTFNEVRGAFQGLENGTSMRDFLDEFNKSGTDTISLSEFASSRTVFITVSSDTTSQNLNTLFEASTEYSGWDSVTPFFMTITINSGNALYSTSSGTPALTIGTIPSNVYVAVINNGNIVGGPGNGGASGTANGGSGGNGVTGGAGVDFTGFTGRGIITNSAKIHGGAGGGGGGNGGASGTHTGQEVPRIDFGTHGMRLNMETRVDGQGQNQHRYLRYLIYGSSTIANGGASGWITTFTGPFWPPAWPPPAAVFNSQMAQGFSSGAESNDGRQVNSSLTGGSTYHWYKRDDPNYSSSYTNWSRVAKTLTFTTNGGAGGAGGNGAVFNGSVNAGGSGGSPTGNNSAKDSSQVGGAGTGTAGGAGGYFTYSSGTDTYTYSAATASSGTAGSQGTGILNKPTNVSQS